ncbi:MAG: hypothetical protein SFY96_12710 [Planctomycetota bacterium]|nr:hypothetical protein [Planctomycetota bacterium]
MSWPVRWLAAGLVLWLCAIAARAQDVASGDAPAKVPAATATASGERPALAGRVVKVFDFEDGLTTGDPIPPFWIRAQDDPDVPRKRPGFSRWNKAEYDFANAKSGKVSVRLPTRGGSTSLLLEPGVLPVFPMADYMISANVRTMNAEHSRAVVLARYLNSKGEPIASSETRSEPVRAEAGWQSVSLALAGGVPDAAFIQIELMLLQPEQIAGTGGEAGGPVTTALARRAWAQDIDASALFDDVSVVQLPRVELRTTSEINVIERPQRPTLALVVRDLTGEPLRAVVQVLDHTGRVIDSREMRVAAGRSREEWSPAITALGWYRATLEVFNDQTRIGATAVDFAWVESVAIAEGSPDDTNRGGPVNTKVARGVAEIGGAAGRSRYGVVATTMPDELMRRLPDACRALGVGWTSVPIWDATLSKDNAATRAKDMSGLLHALAAQWCDVGFALARTPIPAGRTERLDADDPMGLLRLDESYWRPLVDPFVDRFGQQVRRWEIGQVGDGRMGASRTLVADLSRVDRAINKLVPGPIMTAPTTPEQRLPRVGAAGGMTIGVHVGVPPDASVQSAQALGRHWGTVLKNAARSADVTISLLSADVESYGYQSLADQTVKKLASILAAEASVPAAGDLRVGLVDPWTVATDAHATLMPRPEFAAWRNAVRHFADRRIVGEARVAPGVTCYILAPAPGVSDARGGAMVAWSDSAEGTDADIEVWPAEGGATLVDVFGNSTPIATPSIERDLEGTRRSPAIVRVTSSPVFIENVDEKTTRFLASVRLTPPLISTASTDDEHAITFENPWAQPINGQIAILEPGGFSSRDGVRDRAWKISPRVQRFRAAAGANERLPVQIGFSAAEEAGPLPFVMEVSITADRGTDRMLVRVPAELGLTTAHLEVAAHVRGSGPDADVVIEVHVANLAKANANLELTAFAPDMPRMKANVSELGPGNQATRRFVLPRAAGLLSGKRVTVSLSDPEVGIRIARSATVP